MLWISLQLGGLFSPYSKFCKVFQLAFKLQIVKFWVTYGCIKNKMWDKMFLFFMGLESNCTSQCKKIIRNPQSIKHSPQTMFYTDRVSASPRLYKTMYFYRVSKKARA